MNNEYDNNEMKEILNEHDRTMAIGKLPGVGKTTACKNSGYKILFVTPYNKLCQELRKDHFDSVTLNKLLCINIEGNRHKNVKGFNTSNYEAICFDEILMYTPSLLSKIYQYMEENKQLKYFSTGDSNQLPPFGYSYNNIKNIDEYLKNCINIMLPKQILLKENKRLNSIEDKEKLKTLKSELFDQKNNPRNILKLYINIVK